MVTVLIENATIRSGERVDIRLYDSLGRAIARIDESHINDHVLRYDMSKFSSGRYWIVINSVDGNQAIPVRSGPIKLDRVLGGILRIDYAAS